MAGKLGPRGLAQGVVKPKHTSVHSSSTKVGIIDVSVDGARFRPYRRGLANPFAWNSSD